MEKLHWVALLLSRELERGSFLMVIAFARSWKTAENRAPHPVERADPAANGALIRVRIEARLKSA